MVGRLIFGRGRDEDLPDTGEIHAIYLLKEYWNRGFGRQMLDFAFSEFWRTGYSDVFLWAFVDNVRGRRFYEKHGFVLDNKRMELEIDKPMTLVRYLRNLAN